MTALFEQIRSIVEQARGRAVRAVNQAMVEAYWQIGRLIVEDEQSGQSRAAYGAGIIPELSRRLTREYGKGFNESNLRNMRRFYLAFPIQDAPRLELSTQTDTLPASQIPHGSAFPGLTGLRSKLSWTHYRLLLRVENHAAIRTERVLQLQ